MAELKNIRIAVSGLYDYAYEELPTLRIPMPGAGAPDWVEEKCLYKVYRPAPVLAVACPKFANLPMTHHHPKAPVDGQNFRDLAIGWTGEHPEVDYIPETNEVGIKSTCMLYDDEALNAYQNGEVQLSPGYIADFEWQKGTTPTGEEYDIIMREITDVNHVALLPNGRGGKFAVVMDEAPKVKTVFDIVRERAGMSVFELARYTRDERRIYKIGEISEKTGLQKKSDGSWGKPDKGEEKDSDNKNMNENPFYTESKSPVLTENEKNALLEKIKNITPNSESPLDKDFDNLRALALLNKNLTKGYGYSHTSFDDQGYELKNELIKKIAHLYKEKGGTVKKTEDGKVIYFYSPDGRQISFHGSYNNIDVPFAENKEWTGIENSFLAETKEEENKLKDEQEKKSEYYNDLKNRIIDKLKKSIKVKNFLKKKGLQESDLDRLSISPGDLQDSDDINTRYRKLITRDPFFSGLPKISFRDNEELKNILSFEYKKKAKDIYNGKDLELYLKAHS